MLEGMPVSAGYATAKILKMDDATLHISNALITDVDQELNKYEDAIRKSINQLETLKATYAKKFNDDMLSLFDAHIAMTNDIEVVGKVKELIIKKSYNLAYAITLVSEEYIAMFNQIDDEYLKSRAVDLKDVTHRLISNVLHIKIIDLAKINEPVILATKELTPTQATQLNPTYIKGFVSEVGSKTSHSAIIAKLLNIPAVFGVKDLLKHINQDDLAILDGIKGKLYINPTKKQLDTYKDVMQSYQAHQETLKIYEHMPLQTKDKQTFPLLANLSSDRDLEYIKSFSLDGVGLFRTELLFLEHLQMPTYDEQYKVYHQILESFKDQDVTIRTLDIGGDKPLSHVNHPKEENPALGQRGIRFSFLHQDIFETQIKALLTANKYGNLKIMFPMISTIDEFLKAKSIVEFVEQSLIKNKIEVKPYQLGIMIETPSSALMANEFAKVCDFFSIGTNDMVQYTFAIDRLNQNLSNLYQPLHPAILKLIKMTIDAAHKHQVTVSVCGEMASDACSSIILLGLGVDQLSISPSSSLEIKSCISKHTLRQLKEIAQHALSLDNQESVKTYIKNKTNF